MSHDERTTSPSIVLVFLMLDFPTWAVIIFDTFFSICIQKWPTYNFFLQVFIGLFLISNRPCAKFDSSSLMASPHSSSDLVGESKKKKKNIIITLFF